MNAMKQMESDKKNILVLLSLVVTLSSSIAFSQHSEPRNGATTIDVTGHGDVIFEHIGDIEGNTELLRNQMQRLWREGKIDLVSPSVLESTNPIDWVGAISVKPGVILIFAGDIGDPLTGPFASESYAFVNELKRRQPSWVYSNLGNRETNKPRLLHELVGNFDQVAKSNEFAAWAQSKGLAMARTDDPALRLRFIFEKTMGATPAFENHRRAVQDRLVRAGHSRHVVVPDSLVVAAVMLDYMSSDELERFYPTLFEPAQAALKEIGVSFTSIHPQPGAVREYIRTSQYILHFQLRDADLVVTHGSPTAMNLGKVPFGLGESEVREAKTLSDWTKQLNQQKASEFGHAFDFAAQAAPGTTNPAVLMVEYGSYNFAIRNYSIIASKSGSTDAMIKADFMLILKARWLSSGRPVVFMSGHTPGRNIWKSEDAGPRVMRITNDPTGDGGSSNLSLVNRDGRTMVHFTALIRIDGVVTNIVLTHELLTTPKDSSLAGSRVFLNGRESVVIGKVDGAADRWLLEHVDSQNGFKTERWVVDRQTIEAHRIEIRMQGRCQQLFMK